MGDIIVGVNGETVAQKDHPYVVNLIRSTQATVTIQLATLQLLKQFAMHTSSNSNAVSLTVDLANDGTAAQEAQNPSPSHEEAPPLSPTY